MARLVEMDRLARVLDLRVRRAQMDLAQITAEEAALRKALADLARPNRDPQPTGPAAPDIVANAAVELRWQRWAEARRRMLHSNLARVLARRADARQALAKAVGKDAALAALRSASRK